VVIGHSTKSIAQYVPKLLGVTNDHTTKTVIPSSICIYLDMGVPSMTTFLYCKECNKLFDKELGCSTCLANSAYSADAHKPNQTTIEALEEALDER
jgi:hypothetical protein